MTYKKTLLIVEDNADHLKWLSAIFKENYDVLSASTGAHALHIFSHYQHNIDALVLDIRLPDMTSFELLNSLEKMCFTSIPPTIIQTEYDDIEWMRSLFGAYRTLNYLVKPFEAEEILVAVTDALDANPFIYKGTQINERMSVMTAIHTVRLQMYHHASQLAPNIQQKWMPKVLDLFHVTGKKDNLPFPSGDSDDFKLTASLDPIFDLVTQFYNIQLPTTRPILIGVHPALADKLRASGCPLYSDEGLADSILIEKYELETPHMIPHLDIWLNELTPDTIHAWQNISDVFYSNGMSDAVLGIALVSQDTHAIMKEAVNLGISQLIVWDTSLPDALPQFVTRTIKRKSDIEILKCLEEIIKDIPSRS